MSLPTILRSLTASLETMPELIAIGGKQLIEMPGEFKAAICSL